ncbi:MAG TPA: FMN-binding glutamate synthase family protein [Puia sp.]|nr:FMN-binding glutamate synthase family protein [Puia sp.]
MTSYSKRASARALIILLIVAMNVAIIIPAAGGDYQMLFLLPVSLFLLFVAIANLLQKKHTLLRNYPVVGYLRYWMERLRPGLRQYFFESDTDGKPFSRRQRSLVYQRAKNERQTVAFGMQLSPEKPGYEWIAHSLYPVHIRNRDLRVWIGNSQCSQPYHASILNIGAMSYGALSKTAVQALNEGAALGSFAQNTGEGGISAHHLHGGDLIWQVGTGYFGCRNADGNFDAARFRINAIKPEVKMIELKLSQGAKPGHGGILPGIKNTPEIAAIRQVNPGATIASPSGHTAFSNAETLMLFLEQLRELSEGKPVGFKLCIGSKKEFYEICHAIRKTGIIPDFIVVDGAEGGTGAAPLEFADHVGMPLYEALSFVSGTLKNYRLENEIRIIAAGKIISGFDILKALALGASACYSSRGMMFALGCIQSLQCDSGTCPTGIATQNPGLFKGLDPTDKRIRVANFHTNTIKATVEIMEACGFKSAGEVNVASFFRRMDATHSRSFKAIYEPEQSIVQPDFIGIKN